MVKIRVHGTPEEVESTLEVLRTQFEIWLRVIGEDRFTKAVVICYNDNSTENYKNVLLEYAKSPRRWNTGAFIIM